MNATTSSLDVASSFACASICVNVAMRVAAPDVATLQRRFGHPGGNFLLLALLTAVALAAAFVGRTIMRYIVDMAALLTPGDLAARDLLSWGSWGFACGFGLTLPILQFLALLGDLRRSAPTGVQGNFVLQFLARLHKTQSDLLAAQLRSYISWGLLGLFVALNVAGTRMLISWLIRSISK